MASAKYKAKWPVWHCMRHHSREAAHVHHDHHHFGWHRIRNECGMCEQRKCTRHPNFDGVTFRWRFCSNEDVARVAHSLQSVFMCGTLTVWNHVRCNHCMRRFKTNGVPWLLCSKRQWLKFFEPETLIFRELLIWAELRWERLQLCRIACDLYFPLEICVYTCHERRTRS